MKSETLFEDTKFPKGDIWGGKYDPDIIWKRAKYLAPQTPWFYFEDGASRFHVNQGELGNCWFVQRNLYVLTEWEHDREKTICFAIYSILALKPILALRR